MTRRAVVVAVASTVVALLAGFAVLRVGPGSRDAGPAASPSWPASCPPLQAGEVKPVLTGFVGLGGVGTAAHLLIAETVNVRWAELQPADGAPLVRPNAIDAALDRARARPCGTVKVRVLAGVESPEWAKNLDGPPIDLTLAYDSRSGSVPRFWTSAFASAYASLQGQLAALYDSHPAIREVVVSGCTTFYAEPLLRQASDGANAGALAGAGYNDQQDAICQRAQLEAHRVWRLTASSYALNPYDRISPQGTPSVDPLLSVSLGALCRQILGVRCVLANNSVRWPQLAGPYAVVYTGMRDLGPPLAFQLAAPRRVGDVVRSATWAIDLGASSVEILPWVAAEHADALARLAPQLDARTGG